MSESQLVVGVNKAMPPRKTANNSAAASDNRASSGQARNSFIPPANVQASVPVGGRWRQRKSPPHRAAFASSQKSRTPGALSMVARLKISVPSVSNAPQAAEARMKQ